MDTRPSRKLTALAAFGAFWLSMSICVALMPLVGMDKEDIRDIAVPLSFIFASALYFEVRFKQRPAPSQEGE